MDSVHHEPASMCVEELRDIVRKSDGCGGSLVEQPPRLVESNLSLVKSKVHEDIRMPRRSPHLASVAHTFAEPMDISDSEVLSQ